MIGTMKTSVVVADGTFPSSTAPLTGDWETVCRQAAEIGFDGILLTVNDPAEVDVAALRHALTRYDLAVSAIATGRAYSVDGLWLASPEEAVRQAALRRMEGQIRLSQALGGQPYVIVGAIRGKAEGHGGPAVCGPLLRASMESLLALAEEARVDLLFEAIELSESDLYRDVEETADFLRSFHSRRLFLQLDTMHMANESQDYRRLLPRTAPLLAQVDLSGPAREVPQAGLYDYAGLMRLLGQIRYEGWLAFEYATTPGGAQAGYDYIRSLVPGAE